MRESIRRKSKIGKIDMDMVNKLIDWQKQLNSRLAGTEHSCNLRPDISKTICETCPFKKACFKYEWERDYIHKEASKANKRRERVKDNPKRHLDSFEESENSAEEDIEDYEDDYKEISSEDSKYPCKEMHFACPNNGKCKYGKNCPWYL